MLPYLTGAWSVPFGRPPMPCDGVLLGSRMMVATDAHTSPAVKKLLLRAPGVDDARWEESYRSADEAGGVLTVTSEAIVDQDPERVCVLQSPVSVRYSTRDYQSSKEILDGIRPKSPELPTHQRPRP